MESSVRDAFGETPSELNSRNKGGGWVTFPFISVSMVGMTLAGAGWMNNLQVYMIKEFHVKNIDSAQISSVVSGCVYMLPLLAAIIADSYLGSFAVICISSLFSLLMNIDGVNKERQGTFLLMLTATIESLRPPPCKSPNSCISPTKQQIALLYISLASGVLGVSGSRFTIQAMGAAQFRTSKEQSTLFNWLFCALYVSFAISTTLIFYVEENTGFGMGFQICLVANVIGLVAFLVGKRYYRDVKPKGSPYTGLACVVIASFRKRKLFLSGTKKEDYYNEKTKDGGTGVDLTPPSESFKFLNRAALKTEGDIRPDGSTTKKWKICSVQQVEDLKTLIKMVPIWSTGILLLAPLTTQLGLTILQALKMDRQLGHGFKIPAGSMIVFILAPTAISLIIFDCFLGPTWKKLTGRSMTPLQRFGMGHIFTILSMVISALVEIKRLNKVKADHFDNLSVMWLVPQLAISGIGEAFHVPGSTEFFYREFPVSLKTTSTSIMSLFVGVGYYVSTALIGLIRRATTWLPNDINQGRMDKVFWLLSLIALINFGYYLICAWLYRCKGVEEEVDEGLLSSSE